MARTAERTVTLILDPRDALADLEELRRLHSRPYGQILCEPDPTATRTGLAHHLLASLGKHPDVTAPGSPWPLVESHLKAERVRDLVLARAHTLTYTGLRHVADHAHQAGITLWLWSATERPTPALAQLLEARPHQRATIGQLLDRWRRPPPDPELPALPASGGLQYPWLTPCSSDRLRSRTALAAGLTAADRWRVAETWIAATEWTDAWLAQNPRASEQELADALYTLTAAADTASEQITRAQAAITTLHHHGLPVDRALLRHDFTLSYGESRPQRWRDTVADAAQLAGQAPDPHDAALIVLSTIFRDPWTVIRVRVADVTPDGAITRPPWGRPRAVPPQLRAPLTAQYDRLHHDLAPDLGDPLLAGTSDGHMTGRTIERAMKRLDVPATLWRSGTTRDEFEGPQLDGRTILADLNPITLFAGSAHH